MILIIVIIISLLMVSLAIIGCIPEEEKRKARAKREFDKAVKEVNNPTSYKGRDGR